jgi:hypothetical protein
MTGLWIAIAFVFWYALSLYISESLDRKSRINKQWLFFVSFVFSPVAGMLLVFFKVKSQTKTTNKH